MTDTDAYLQSLKVTSPLVEPIHRTAIHALQLPSGSRGLDAGCGIGLQAVLLAEAVGPAGHVTALDLSPGLLAYAGEIVAKAGLSERISLQEGDVRELPFDDESFDWAWSADCVGYGPQLEPLPLLKELARVVKPGGTVVILAWFSQTLLPGFPLWRPASMRPLPGLPLSPGAAGRSRTFCVRSAGSGVRAWRRSRSRPLLPTSMLR